jgi:hypothetical protein
MRIIACTFAALVGSSFGGVIRIAVDAVADRAAGDASPEGPVTANGAVLSSIGVGLVSATLGRSPRLAFWLGAVLGAAGADRFDDTLFARFGINRDALMARAREAVARQRGAHPEGAEA